MKNIKGCGRRDWRPPGGFSLVELLAVLVVMLVLAALSVPAANRMLRASSLNSAGRVLVDQLNLARQVALTKGLPVEVRLYKLPDYTEPSTASPTVFRAFQLFLLDEEGVANPLAKAEFFQVPVVVSQETSESGLFSDTSSHAEVNPGSNGFGLPVFQANYRYVAFTFLPGGSTDLNSGRNFVTLVLQNDRPLVEGTNFFTVQLDPVSGSVRHFRP
jgi:uncharacterized protein (TIGR02596 family)